MPRAKHLPYIYRGVFYENPQTRRPRRPLNQRRLTVMSNTPATPATRGRIQYAPVLRTERGTPCAKSWTEAWIKQVEAVEHNLGRNICGAKLAGGRPCEVESDHDSGRCRYHGGFESTGAPKGNRNAEIHALYSRRLRLCSRDCPLWTQCPYAGADVEKLEAIKRPTCPYEQDEYDLALEGALELAALNPQPNPMASHIAHNIAIIQVLFNRAALALRNASLVTNTLSNSLVNPRTGAYVVESKPSAELTAFVRIAAEYRRFAALLLPGKNSKQTAKLLAKLAEHPPTDDAPEGDSAPDTQSSPNAPEPATTAPNDQPDKPDRSDRSDRSEQSDLTSHGAPEPALRRADFLKPPGIGPHPPLR